MPASYFTITVDTEADNAWQHPDRIGLENLNALPRFQRLCEAYGIVPVYLVTYECATRKEALAILQPIADSGRCEIGYHFHAWTTPPFENETPDGIDANWLQAYQYELPDSLFQEKAERLLGAITRAFGITPTVHRSGRWGIDQRSIDWLVDHDFLVDTSVVPLLSLSANKGKSTGGPSFTRAPMGPFLWARTERNGSGPPSLIEIPLTVYNPATFAQRMLAASARGDTPVNRLALRLYTKLIGSKGLLRPDPQYRDHVLTDIVLSHLKSGSSIVNMMIHSSELALGGSPFSMSRESCDRVWKRLETVFALANALEMKSRPISSVAKKIERHLPTHENPHFTS